MFPLTLRTALMSTTAVIVPPRVGWTASFSAGAIHEPLTGLIETTMRLVVTPQYLAEPAGEELRIRFTPGDIVSSSGVMDLRNVFVAAVPRDQVSPLLATPSWVRVTFDGENGYGTTTGEAVWSDPIRIPGFGEPDRRTLIVSVHFSTASAVATHTVLGGRPSFPVFTRAGNHAGAVGGLQGDWVPSAASRPLVTQIQTRYVDPNSETEPEPFSAVRLRDGFVPDGYVPINNNTGIENVTGGADYRRYALMNFRMPPANRPQRPLRATDSQPVAGYYWEVHVQPGGPSTQNGYIGLVTEAQVSGENHGFDLPLNPIFDGSVALRGSGAIWGPDGVELLGPDFARAYTENIVVMFLYDPWAGRLWIGRQGVWNLGTGAPADEVLSTDQRARPVWPFLQARDAGQRLRAVTALADLTYPPPAGAITFTEPVVGGNDPVLSYDWDAVVAAADLGLSSTQSDTIYATVLPVAATEAATEETWFRARFSGALSGTGYQIFGAYAAGADAAGDPDTFANHVPITFNGGETQAGLRNTQELWSDPFQLPGLNVVPERGDTLERLVILCRLRGILTGGSGTTPAFTPFGGAQQLRAMTLLPGALDGTQFPSWATETTIRAVSGVQMAEEPPAPAPVPFVPQWQDAFALADQGTSGGWSGQTIRARIPASAVQSVGRLVRFRLRPPPGGVLALDSMFVTAVPAAQTGFNASGWRQVRFSGRAAVGISDPIHMWSDFVEVPNYGESGFEQLIVSFRLTSGGQTLVFHGVPQNGIAFAHRPGIAADSSLTWDWTGIAQHLSISTLQIALAPGQTPETVFDRTVDDGILIEDLAAEELIYAEAMVSEIEVGDDLDTGDVEVFEVEIEDGMPLAHGLTDLLTAVDAVIDSADVSDAVDDELIEDTPPPGEVNIFIDQAAVLNTDRRPTQYVFSEGDTAFVQNVSNNLARYVQSRKMLSVGNLELAYTGARGYYWEIICTGGAAAFDGYMGVVSEQLAATWTNAANPLTLGSIAWRGSGGGELWSAAGVNAIQQRTNVLGGYGNGDRLMFAYEPVTGRFYLGKNGDWEAGRHPADNSDNPSFTTTPVNMFVSLQGRGIGDAARLFSTPAEFSYAVPTGFIPLSREVNLSGSFDQLIVPTADAFIGPTTTEADILLTADAWLQYDIS